MIRRRAATAGIAAEIGCHTFRATEITAYLANGGVLEHAQEMAAHEVGLGDRGWDRAEPIESAGVRVPGLTASSGNSFRGDPSIRPAAARSLGSYPIVKRTFF
jgi:hypothetical protein